MANVRNVVYYNVKYVDDFNKRHMTIARNKAELKFIKDRFDKVDYEAVSAEVEEK